MQWLANFTVFQINKFNHFMNKPLFMFTFFLFTSRICFFLKSADEWERNVSWFLDSVWKMTGKMEVHLEDLISKFLDYFQCHSDFKSKLFVVLELYKFITCVWVISARHLFVWLQSCGEKRVLKSFVFVLNIY